MLILKVERVGQKLYTEPVRKVESKHIENKSPESEKPVVDEAVKYTPSETVNTGTYNKSGHVYDSETVTKLKRQSEQAHNYLRELVEKLLLKQGHSLKTITDEEWTTVEIDDATRAEAAAMIAPGGPLSAEAVSDRLVDFAKAISGGDIEKLDQLKGAIEQGFKEAEKILGELPEISKETYRLTMEKLDQWATESRSPQE